MSNPCFVVYFLYFIGFSSLVPLPSPPPSPQKTWGGKYKNSGGFPPGEFKSFPPKTPATQNEEESGVHERIQNEKSRVGSGSEEESKTGMGIEPRTATRNRTRTRRRIIRGFCTKNTGFSIKFLPVSPGASHLLLIMKILMNPEWREIGGTSASQD